LVKDHEFFVYLRVDWCSGNSTQLRGHAHNKKFPQQSQITKDTDEKEKNGDEDQVNYPTSLRFLVESLHSKTRFWSAPACRSKASRRTPVWAETPTWRGWCAFLETY